MTGEPLQNGFVESQSLGKLADELHSLVLALLRELLHELVNGDWLHSTAVLLSVGTRALGNTGILATRYATGYRARTVMRRSGGRRI